MDLFVISSHSFLHFWWSTFIVLSRVEDDLLSKFVTLSPQDHPSLLSLLHQASTQIVALPSFCPPHHFFLDSTVSSIWLIVEKSQEARSTHIQKRYIVPKTKHTCWELAVLWVWLLVFCYGWSFGFVFAYNLWSLCIMSSHCQLLVSG